MTQKLTEEIVYYIFSNLGLYNNHNSIINNNFLLSEQIIINQEAKNIYGCQFTTLGVKGIKLLIADLSDDNQEYCLIVQSTGAPTYGVYLIFDSKETLVSEIENKEALIGVNTDKFWMPCTVYLQATFLAGMEQLKDLGTGWNKATDYQELYQKMVSFITFHEQMFGDQDEGKEG
jgi:hypothetical protein